LVKNSLVDAVSQSSGTPVNRDRRCSATVSLSLRLTRFLYGVVSIHGYSRPLPHHTLADTVPSWDCPAVFRLFWHVAQTGGLPNSTAKVSERLFVHVVDSGGLSNNPGYGKNRWPNTTHRTHPNPTDPKPVGKRLFLLVVGNGGPSSAGSDEFSNTTESLLSGSDQQQNHECQHQSARPRHDDLSSNVSRPRRAARSEATRRHDRRRCPARARDGVSPMLCEALSRSQQPIESTAHEAREDASRERSREPRRGPNLGRMAAHDVGTEYEARESAPRHRAGCLTPKFGVGGHMRYARSPVACSAGLTARPRRIQ